MNTLLKRTKKNVKKILIDRVFAHSGDEYQRTRFPQDKFRLITSHLQLSEIGNVLDVGCNEGYISAEFAKHGKFVVGIDAGPLFLNHVLTDLENVYERQNPAFGVFPLTADNVALLPGFDLILLLSVHHQWMKRFGIGYAEELVRRLFEKAQRYLVIEFAARVSKYGLAESAFIDNDEESVKAYAEAWLRRLDIPASVKYIGKNRESSDSTEPYRFLYLVTKDNQ